MNEEDSDYWNTHQILWQKERMPLFPLEDIPGLGWMDVASAKADSVLREETRVVVPQYQALRLACELSDLFELDDIYAFCPEHIRKKLEIDAMSVRLADVNPHFFLTVLGILALKDQEELDDHDIAVKQTVREALTKRLQTISRRALSTGEATVSYSRAGGRGRRAGAAPRGNQGDERDVLSAAYHDATNLLPKLTDTEHALYQWGNSEMRAFREWRETLGTTVGVRAHPLVAQAAEERRMRAAREQRRRGVKRQRPL
ncbi:unnamed protein product [Vitrella brassicaformis CCMP3155]|uniref:GINS subunit domain-containing protein n=2 Tax=Vitrella brassicaformis TaxID=1169539 RepID=A0A0G4H1T8_VITBC|nr:unnamed protein product [Vitrella brassicaformis CCMP3155]|mmetsp:Transcript_45793/g.113806  ORF Transcript_45793/g.113806 Transcript_45793/m.113806 type:complete len:258 (+) Transcript_45793:179-952(+)|eukprot:CEM37591.1 unnamed protein product [Vitrella brassicaformis CCMP3155]